MAELERTPNNNLFVDSNDPLEITLRIKDDFVNHYNNNNENKLKAEQVIQKLTSNHSFCYFQKQKPDSKTNLPKHKLIIPLENDNCIEATLGLYKDKVDTFTELYSYRVLKFKESVFVKEPTKNTIKSNCIFKFLELDKKGGTSSEKFKTLFQKIESEEVPTIDINKEKDKRIWHNYVVALKHLVKQKEQVWKIKRVSEVYYEQREGDLNRAAYIDIYINEDDLMKQMEEDILELFPEKDLEDYGVTPEKAFIEFKHYRLLGTEELNKLKTLGEELFYELSAKSPKHILYGEIDFKYSTIDSKRQIFNELSKYLFEKYQLDILIADNGHLNCNSEDISHIEKVVSDSYANLLEVNKNSQIDSKVEFQIPFDFTSKVQKIKNELNEEGFDKCVVKNISNTHLVIEVPKFIHSDAYVSEGLIFDKSISKFQSNKRINAVPIQGVDLIDGVYQISNAKKADVDRVLSVLKSKYPGVDFFRKPTAYYFKPTSQVPLSILRDFKTKADIQGKVEFNIATSVLRISCDNEIAYNQEIRRVQGISQSAVLEKKPFSLLYYLKFRSEAEPQRQSIINRVLNEIRTTVGFKFKTDIIKNHTRVLFEVYFVEETDRDKFKTALNNSCRKFNDVLSYKLTTELGQTVYELYKNQTLEVEKQKEIAGNVRQATFIYITPEQRQNLSEAIERYGFDAKFFDGISIGTLMRKERDRLKFRINEKFEDLLDAKEDERISLNQLAKGYIKPIFPGELTNIDRMIKAMKKVTEPGNRIGFPINKNLPNFLFDPCEARIYNADISEEEKRIVSNLNEPLLKQQAKQLEAVTKAILSNDMALIQGPPGTGKTTVIAEIIWQTLLKNPQSKILITSQTNLAVDNALERLAGKKLVRPIRIGNIDKFENEGKVYSNDRIRKWLNAKNEKDENDNADNAICEWIENVKHKCSQEEKYSKAVEKWKDGLSKGTDDIKKAFGTSYYKYVNIFAATCSECGSKNFAEAYQSTFQNNSDALSEPSFDVVIMDEASKATPPELVLPLTLGQKVIIIGDHKQLPPMIDADEFSEALEAVGAKTLIEHWTQEDYKVSQFEKLFKNAPKEIVASLDTQFRMHEQIMDTISQFYKDQEELENGLICGIKHQMDIPDFSVKASRWHGLQYEPFIKPTNHAIWVNVDTPETKVNTSYENDGEVNAIKMVLKALLKAKGFDEYYKSCLKDEDKEVGIITYYSPQMSRIKNALYPHFTKADWKNFEQNKYNNEYQLPFRINTVDRFQGMERNIIIISTVRSHLQLREENGKMVQYDNNKYPKALGFAKELQRVNVGFSRAKRLLIVVGNEAHFSNKPEYMEAIRKMHCIDISQLQNLSVL